VLAADFCAKAGLIIEELSPGMIRELNGILRRGGTG